MDIDRFLEAGYSPEDIIENLSRAFPAFGKRLNYAQQAGYTGSQILNFLKNLTGTNIKHIEKSHSSDVQAAREHSKGGGPEGRFLKRLPSILGPIAGTAAVGYGLSKAVPALASRALPALTRSLPTAAKEMLGIGENLTPGMTPPSIPAPTPPTTPQMISKVTPGQGAALINQMGDSVKGIIQSLAGKETPETIATVLDQKILSPGQKKWLSEQGVDLKELIQDFISSGAKNGETAQIQPQERPPMESQSQKLDEATKTPEIGSSAILPSGDIGNIQSIKNGVAKVNIDGKIRNIKEEDLESSPVSEEELADLYKTLESSIQKHTGKEISKMAELVGYSAETNQLQFRPYLGPTYVFDDIDPEDAEFLKNEVTMRKTSGENWVGPWVKGTESVIGNRLHQLLMKYRERSPNLVDEKGNPILTKKGTPKKAHAHSAKFETIYSALEPAQKAAKKQFEKKKSEERHERRAKEKEERAKKRKKPAL